MRCSGLVQEIVVTKLYQDIFHVLEGLLVFYFICLADSSSYIMRRVLTIQHFPDEGTYLVEIVRATRRWTQ